MKKNYLSVYTVVVTFFMSCVFTMQAQITTIRTTDDLKSFRDAVNSGTTYEGSTVTLESDIDLGGESWTPIANTTNEDGNGFRGTFDGKGHTVSKFSVSIDKSIGGNAIAGFFGLNRGTIKNLRIEDSEISASSSGIGTTSSAGAIAGLNRGVILCCISLNNKVTAYQGYGAVSTFQHCALAGGIAGGGYDESSVAYCYAADNTVTADRKTGLGANATARSNDVVSIWENQNSSGSVTNNCTSTTEYTDWVEARNEAAVLYNNFGLGDVIEPYMWDENGFTSERYYYLVVDNMQASEGSVRKAAEVTEKIKEKRYMYDNTEYLFYPAGTTVTVTAYLEGYDSSWSDTGYFLESVTGASATIGEVTSPEDGTDGAGNSTYSFETGRFLRTQDFFVTISDSPSTVSYTTTRIIPTSVSVVTRKDFHAYGAKGRAFVEAAAGSIVTVYDLSGRLVFRTVACQDRTEIELHCGYYIINGIKVAVQ